MWPLRSSRFCAAACWRSSAAAASSASSSASSASSSPVPPNVPSSGRPPNMSRRDYLLRLLQTSRPSDNENDTAAAAVLVSQLRSALSSSSSVAATGEQQQWNSAAPLGSLKEQKRRLAGLPYDELQRVVADTMAMLQTVVNEHADNKTKMIHVAHSVGVLMNAAAYWEHDDTVQKMLDAFKHIIKPPQQPIVHYAALSAFCAMPQGAAHAVNVLKTMNEAGWAPTGAAYKSLMAHYAQHQNPRDMVRIMEKMLQSDITLSRNAAVLALQTLAGDRKHRKAEIDWLAHFLLTHKKGVSGDAIKALAQTARTYDDITAVVATMSRVGRLAFRDALTFDIMRATVRLGKMENVTAVHHLLMRQRRSKGIFSFPEKQYLEMLEAFLNAQMPLAALRVVTILEKQSRLMSTFNSRRTIMARLRTAGMQEIETETIKQWSLLRKDLQRPLHQDELRALIWALRDTKNAAGLDFMVNEMLGQAVHANHSRLADTLRTPTASQHYGATPLSERTAGALLDALHHRGCLGSMRSFLVSRRMPPISNKLLHWVVARAATASDLPWLEDLMRHLPTTAAEVIDSKELGELLLETLQRIRGSDHLDPKDQDRAVQLQNTMQGALQQSTAITA